MGRIVATFFLSLSVFAVLWVGSDRDLISNWPRGGTAHGASKNAFRALGRILWDCLLICSPWPNKLMSLLQSQKGFASLLTSSLLACAPFFWRGWLVHIHTACCGIASVIAVFSTCSAYALPQIVSPLIAHQTVTTCMRYGRASENRASKTGSAHLLSNWDDCLARAGLVPLQRQSHASPHFFSPWCSVFEHICPRGLMCI